MNSGGRNKEEGKEIPGLKSWRNYILGKMLKWLPEEQLIFHSSHPESKIYPPQYYAKHGFSHVAEFKEDSLKIIAKDGSETKLGLWIKEPDDASKPTYVLFHGRHGNWALTGRQGEISDGSYSRSYRMRWLEEIAKSGAGIIAVHTRRQGLSRGPDTNIGEKWYQDDIDGLSKYILKKKKPGSEHTLTGDDLIIAGDSNGGALAAMLAEKLTKMHQSPAMLALINTYACMADPVAQFFREKKLLTPSLSPEELKKHPDCEEICRYHREIIYKNLKNKFDTEKRIGTLDPDKTRIYIANNLDDRTIPFDQHAKLCHAAEKRGLKFKSQLIEGDYINLPYTDTHENWNPAMIVKDIDDFYKESRVPPLPDPPFSRNGFSRNGFSHKEDSPPPFTWTR